MAPYFKKGKECDIKIKEALFYFPPSDFTPSTTLHTHTHTHMHRHTHKHTRTHAHTISILKICHKEEREGFVIGHAKKHFQFNS